MITTINNKHKKLNVPNLRFPEFKGEWHLCKISNILRIGNGRDYKHLAKGNIPVFGTGGYMTSVNDYLYDGETTFIGRKGTINKPYYYKGKFWTVDTLFYTHSFDGIMPHFVYCLFQTINWLKYNEASGVPSLSKDTIEKIKVHIPQIKEQQKISRLILLLDERIATQNKIIEDLKMLKSAIIENVFDDKHSERLQLDNFGSYIRGLTYSSNNVVDHGGTLVMRSNNIVNGSLLDYNNNVVFVNKQMSAEQQLQNGDIVICMANGSSSLVGKSSFYDGNCHSPITVGTFCGIYRSKEPIVKWLFQTNKYRRYIWNSLQGGNGAIANLNGEDILNMSFSIPNAPIKDTCVKMLTSVDSALENNMSLCALYTLQKQHLLRQMFI